MVENNSNVDKIRMLNENLIIILCIFFASAHVQPDFENDELSSEEQMIIENKMQSFKVRCSRRFTPGACIEAVTSVWTFEFQIQNCTERLGCPSSYRTNRFKDYESCMKRCHVLIELYTQILAYEGPNSTSLLFRQNEGLPGRREGSDRVINTPPLHEYDEVESSGDEAINARFAYGELETNDDDYILQWR